jgi:hypothetical protein
MSDCLPLPSAPGYTIIPRGEVRNRLGALMQVDAYGRVNLPNAAGSRKKRFLGELLAEAGFFASSDASALAEDAKDSLRKELEKVNFELAGARGALEHARKANALLIGIREALTKENERLQAAASKAKTGKKSAPPPRSRFDDDAFPDDVSLDDWGDL